MYRAPVWLRFNCGAKQSEEERRAGFMRVGHGGCGQMPDYVNVRRESFTELTAGCRLHCMCVVSLRVSLLFGVRVCVCETVKDARRTREYD